MTHYSTGNDEDDYEFYDDNDDRTNIRNNDHDILVIKTVVDGKKYQWQ